MAPVIERPLFPQALATSFATRLRNENTSLYVAAVPSRSTKRAHTAINYAEFDRDDFLFEDDEDKDDTYDSDDDGITRRANANPTIDLSNFQGKEAPKTRPIAFSEQELRYNASLPVVMVPIKINLEYNSAKISDAFMWNANESLITPEAFAATMCQDLELPPSYQQQIASSIVSQIEEYQAIAATPLPKEGDGLHIIVHLSVNLDKDLYEDNLEWDLLNEDLTPEDFAYTVVSEMGLSSEFRPAIAQALHEMLLKMKREFLENPQLALWQLQDLPKQNKVYQTSPEVLSGENYECQGLRFDIKDLGREWSPTIETLSQWEIEKREIERERNIRRLKRESMRVGEEFPGGKRRMYRRRYDELEGTMKPL
ncbi:unnamed protein product [Kuraishia capsulata CBS 1993]|uniref:Chromatin structure-remodeling complex subunit SFH1 n=1 Tax=Kuraishia capsulata CBS 1993 TaxID=1382522 RepID=W6MUW6_9ASCO|nr:uncharacterized protein KUCA_T00005590001 [Kuraishia capsulata CBS 1993]CDK29597.1 unnamed protein product [Kuraishia capsulata CBS 1993]